MKRSLLVILGILFGLLVFHVLVSFLNIAFLKPWRFPQIPRTIELYPYSGAIHIHSRFSDGSGELHEIVAAAREEKLDFLWITDHNTLSLFDSSDAYQRPVLMVGAELSLKPGHVITWNAARLDAGNASNLLLDTLDLVIVAHPLHPKIRWKEEYPVAVDGLEILNADVEWRNDTALELIGAVFAIPFFEYAMNLLIDPPLRELRLWDSLSTYRPVSGIGSVDAHAKIKLSKTDYWKFPSYQKMFALIQNVIYRTQPLPDSPSAARTAIAEAIRAGHLIFGFAGLGDLKAVRIFARNKQHVYFPGDTLNLDPDAPAQLHVSLPPGFEFETYLYHNGVRIRQSRLSEILWNIEHPGRYRIVVHQRRLRFPLFTRKNVPWIFSNPFYVRPVNDDEL